MGFIHRTGVALGVGFQVHSGPASVSVRSFGDTLTNAGQLAIIAAVQTYYAGLAGGTVIGPSTASAGGAAAQAGAVFVSPTAVDVLVKPGDEATVAASLATVLGVNANTTHNVPASGLFTAVN